MFRGLSAVITGAPNLSNEAGVRGEARSVSEKEEERRARNEDGELRAIRVRTCCSCGERSRRQVSRRVQNADTLRRKHVNSEIPLFPLLICCNPCGILFYFFLEGVYLNPSARSAVYLLIPPSFLMECAAHENERSRRGLSPPARYRAREVHTK